MKTKLPFTLLLFLLLFYCSQSWAAIKYLRQDAAGAANGNNWTDAYTTFAALETALARGDTGYVADGAYTNADIELNTAHSGTTRIFIKKATVADHGTDTGWSDTYGDGQAILARTTFTTGYWTVDGQARSSWTNGYGIKYWQPTGAYVVGIDGPWVTNRYVEVEGGGDDGGGSGQSNDGVVWTTQNTGDYSTFEYSYLHDFGRCVFFANRSVLSNTIQFCYTGRYESVESEHSEWASLWGGVGFWTIRYNIISYVEGTGGIMYDNVGHNTDPIWIYGNVFDESKDGPWEASNGVIGGWDSAGAEWYNCFVYNNTFISNTVPVFANRDRAGSNGATNNLFYGCSALAFTDISHNYNHFIFSGGTYSESQGTSGSGNPFVNYPALDYSLTANTTTGLDLGSPYNTDYLGNTRTTWTRGALEFQSTPTPPATGTLRVNNLRVRNAFFR